MQRSSTHCEGSRRLRAGLAALLGALLVIQGSLLPAAAKEKKEKRKSYTVSEWVFKRLEKAHGFLGEEQYPAARQAVDEIAGRRNTNPHEKALMYQTYGFIEAGQDRYIKAAEYFEKCLAQDALPEAAQLNTEYNLAQIYLAAERYGRGAEILERWLARAENPAPSAYYLLAVAYAQMDRFDKALAPAKTAVDKAKRPKESWLQLLLSIYFEKKDYRNVARILERLVARFPKRSYWLQLAGAYSELGKEKSSLAVQQIAYEQGFLDEDKKLRQLAQLYLYHDIPYWAARVVEKGIDEKVIEGDAKAWELLANSWINAREYEKSLPPLVRAAELSGDGELYVRLAQVHLEREAWAKAASALQKALSKGGLKDRGRAHLLLGIARFERKRYAEAGESFARAQGFEKTRASATQWLKHVEHELQIQAIDAG